MGHQTSGHFNRKKPILGQTMTVLNTGNIIDVDFKFNSTFVGMKDGIVQKIIKTFAHDQYETNTNDP